ncbi:hypothetical protein SGPA1_40719 [Streptomyces misionensis JCM 4497]
MARVDSVRGGPNGAFPSPEECYGNQVASRGSRAQKTPRPHTPDAPSRKSAKSQHW